MGSWRCNLYLSKPWGMFMGGSVVDETLLLRIDMSCNTVCVDLASAQWNLWTNAEASCSNCDAPDPRLFTLASGWSFMNIPPLYLRTFKYILEPTNIHEIWFVSTLHDNMYYRTQNPLSCIIDLMLMNHICLQSSHCFCRHYSLK